MDKARIVLDVEKDLKDYFVDRVSSLRRKGASVTSLLMLSMYNILEMDNGELERFFDHGLMVGAMYRSYSAMAQKAIDDGLLSKDFKIGNSRFREITTVLTQYNMKEITEEEAKTRLQAIEKRIYGESSQRVQDMLNNAFDE